MESQSINIYATAGSPSPSLFIDQLALAQRHHLALPPLRLRPCLIGGSGFMVGRAFLAQAGGGRRVLVRLLFFCPAAALTWRPDMTGPALEGQCPQS
jgi:hypothetical protein